MTEETKLKIAKIKDKIDELERKQSKEPDRKKRREYSDEIEHLRNEILRLVK